MGLRATILRVTSETGPRGLNVLQGLARTAREKLMFSTIFQTMRAKGEIVMYGSKRGTKWGAPGWRQRGVTLIQAAIALAALASLVAATLGAIAWVDSRGYNRGVAETETRWNEANRKAQAEQRAREAAVAAALAEEQDRRLSAEARAEQNDRKWREAVRDSRRNKVALGTCVQPATKRADAGADGRGPHAGAGELVGGGIRAPSVGADAARDPVLGSIRLTWEFVRLYDAAWTSRSGEPVFESPAGGEAAQSADASPYGLDEVIEVHGENAASCSADRREFQALIGRIEAAEAAWGKGPQQ